MTEKQTEKRYDTETRRKEFLQRKGNHDGKIRKRRKMRRKRGRRRKRRRMNKGKTRKRERGREWEKKRKGKGEEEDISNPNKILPQDLPAHQRRSLGVNINSGCQGCHRCAFACGLCAMDLEDARPAP